LKERIEIVNRASLSLERKIVKRMLRQIIS